MRKHRKITILSQNKGCCPDFISKERCDVQTNPYAPIENTSFIIKEHFHVPEISFCVGMSYNAFMLEYEKNTKALYCPQNFQSVRNMFTLQGVDARVMSKLEDVACDALYLGGFVTPLHLLKLPSVGRVIIGNEIKTPHIESCEAVYNTLISMPETAITEQFISFKVVMHRKTVANSLRFLELMGCAKQVVSYNDMISIQKRGEQPAELEFHAIPEGTYSTDKLMAALRCNPDEIIPRLKKYENKGLVFGYTQNIHREMWTSSGEFDKERYINVMDAVQRSSIWMDQVRTSGDRFVNTEIDNIVMAHCQRHGSQAAIIDGENVTTIDPRGKQIDQGPLNQGALMS